MISSDLVGTWSGTNGFRLMPGDPLGEAPATAAVTTAAGGHLGLVAYTWQHPDDGPQDGLILIAAAGEDGEGGDGEVGDPVSATWADSWHQQPVPMTLTGRRTGGSLVLEGRYGGDWIWRILLAAGPAGELQLRMDNVIPAAHATADRPAGPYPAMLLQAGRS